MHGIEFEQILGHTLLVDLKVDHTEPLAGMASIFNFPDALFLIYTGPHHYVVMP